MKFKKTKLTLSMALAAALISPQVIASNASDIQSLQRQVNEMSNMMRSMQNEIAQSKGRSGGSSNIESSKIQELEHWMQTVKATPTYTETKDDMVFFRGGFSHSNTFRNGVSIQSDVVPFGGQTDRNAWYFGAGFDFSLDDNLFGMMDRTEVIAELMFEYKKLGKTRGNVLADNNSAVTNAVLDVATGRNASAIAPNSRSVTVSQFTLAASPKIKFLKGDALRPWIIPAGFKIDVISPPSESITVLQPGMMFAVGADYNVWKSIYVGADIRYGTSFSSIDGVDTDGYTAGGYLGIGF